MDIVEKQLKMSNKCNCVSYFVQILSMLIRIISSLKKYVHEIMGFNFFENQRAQKQADVIQAHIHKW